MGYLPGLYDIFQERWGQSQSCYIYSDPHFSDDELAGGIKGRPSAEEQIKRINAKCGRRDCLIILGDIGDVEYVRQLRAEYKILIMGNHDAGSSNYKRETYDVMFDQEIYTKEQALAEMKELYPGWKIIIREEYGFTSPFKRWIATADNLLFDEVYEGALMVGEKLIFSHEPVDIPWAYNIHGHDHAGYIRTGHTNVCSDVIGYEPINFNQWLKEGHTARVQTIHRATIDNATKRKAKRGGKTIGEK